MNDRFQNFYSQFSQFQFRYKQFAESHAEEIFTQFKSRFCDLKKSHFILNEFAEESARYHSDHFNIFSILDRDELEVRTHTPFLAALLDPDGSHGQKNLFLKSFLIKLIKLPESEANDHNWQVHAERGYIDLRLDNFVLKKSIFIENKIRTGAHSGQLSRYFKRWIEGYCKGNGAFIYLSPDREKSSPSPDGFDDNVYPRAKVMEDLQIWAYQKEIHIWLTESLPQVKSSRVWETVRQYIDVIKNL